MKTLLTIPATLVFSQFLHAEYGPQNRLARLSSAAAESVRWLFLALLVMVE